MKFKEFYTQVGNASENAHREVDGAFDEREVKIVDIDGFVHQVAKIVWDPEDGCFWIRSTYTCGSRNE